MKKILIMAAAMVATALGGAWALSLADAIAEVGKAIENPSSITDVVKQETGLPASAIKILEVS